jgi:hypothetical protein
MSKRGGIPIDVIRDKNDFQRSILDDMTTKPNAGRRQTADGSHVLQADTGNGDEVGPE